MKDDRFPGWLLFLPAVLFVLAGVIPLVRDRPLNVVFIALAGTWAILGLAMMKGAKREREKKDDEGGKGVQ